MAILNQETITFTIKLISDYWDQPPSAEVSLNDQIKFDSSILEPNTSITFSHTLSFGNQILKIRRYGKTDDQCVNGKDQMLIIKQIIIDDIDIQNIIDSRSYNEPIYPEVWANEQKEKGVELEKRILAETWLGHNSTWSLEFTSPFYKFLIEQMR
jgi:hypothetical protein